MSQINDKKTVEPGSKVAVVTGGSSGVGLATAKRLSALGYCVAICGRRNELLEQAIEQLVSVAGSFADSNSAADDSDRFFSAAADLCDVNQTQQFARDVVASFGHVDVLVNNAGMAPLAPLEEMTDESFEQTLDLNIRSPFYLTRHFWPQMKSRGSGTVVNVSSLAAVDPFPGFSIYGASKAWLDLFTLALAAEGAEAGVRVCSVRPGAVETPLLRSLFPDFPAEQCVSPDDVAATIVGCIEQPDYYPSGQAFEVTNQT